MTASVRSLGLAVGLAAIAVSGCGDTHVSLERERIALGKELMNSLSTAKTFNEMMDRAPQIESIATRMDKLVERKNKLQPVTDSEKSQIAKLRESERADMKAKAEKMQADLQENMSPAKMLAGGMPDLTKMQPFATAMAHLGQANMAYDPEFAAAAQMTSFGKVGEMPSPGKGGLIAIPPAGGGAP